MGYLFGQKRRKVGWLQRQAARCFLMTQEGPAWNRHRNEASRASRLFLAEPASRERLACRLVAAPFGFRGPKERTPAESGADRPASGPICSRSEELFDTPTVATEPRRPGAAAKGAKMAARRTRRTGAKLLAVALCDRGILPDTLRGVPIQSSDARHRRRVKGWLGVHRSWAFN